MEWADEDGTLLEFQKMLRQAFQNADRFIKLVAVHHSLVTFICAAPTWTVGSLILLARDSISILRELGVVILTIGQEVILDDQVVRLEQQISGHTQSTFCLWTASWLATFIIKQAFATRSFHKILQVVANLKESGVPLSKPVVGSWNTMREVKQFPIKL